MDSPLAPCQKRSWLQRVWNALIVDWRHDPIDVAADVRNWVTALKPTDLAGLHLERKADHWWWRWLGKLSPKLVSSYWTTMPWGVIYTPSFYDEDVDWGGNGWRANHIDELTHEARHIEQARHIGPVVFAISYIGWSIWFVFLALLSLAFSGPLAAAFALWALLALPLSFGLAFGRWRIESDAYLVNIILAADRNREGMVEEIVNDLWEGYVWTWPKSWQRKWFNKALATIREMEKPES